MLTKTTTLAAAIAFTTTTAFAGGLSPEITEAPMMEEPMMVEAGPSINPAFIVIGVIAALLIASNMSDDEPQRRQSIREICESDCELVFLDSAN